MIAGRLSLVVNMTLFLLWSVSVIVQQIILVPVFSIYWSSELYSSWLIILSIANLVILADLGLNPLTIVRLQSELAVGEGRNPDKVKRVVANSAFAYLWIIAALLVAAPILSFSLPIPRIFGLSGASDIELRVAFLVTMIGITATAGVIGLAAILRATNHLNGLSAVRIWSAALTLALMYLAISRGWGIVGVAAAYAIANIIEVLAIFFVLVPRALPEFRSVRFSLRDETLPEILGKARHNIIPLSSETVLQSIPTFIMGTIGTSAVGVVAFTLARLVLSALRQISHTVMYPFNTIIGYAWAQSNPASAGRTVTACLAILGAGIGAGIGFFWSFHVPLVRIWTAGVYEADSVVFGLLLVGMATAYPAFVAQNALIFIGQPLDVSRARSIQIALLCVLCVGLGLVFDVRGIAAAVLISEFCAVSVTLTWSMIRKFEIGMRSFWLAVTIPFGGMLALSYLCAEAAQWLRPPVGMTALAIGSAIWAPMPVAAFLAFFYFQTGNLNRPRPA